MKPKTSGLSFVDPRSRPSASASQALARFTSDPTELLQLNELCANARLYEVEEWIRAGKPLQVSPESSQGSRRKQSALEIALEREDHALTLLLLCNGYDPNAETTCPLNSALKSRRWDLVDLLLEWGANPHDVDPDALFDTYRTELYERFLALGVDLTEDNALASALAYHTSNKPLFGFAKRHRTRNGFQAALNSALAHHAGEGNEKGVQLCLWAGADAHAPAADVRYPEPQDDDGEDHFIGFSAVHCACRSGHLSILQRLRADPELDDLDDLYRTAGDASIIDFLAKYKRPERISALIHWRLMLMSWGRAHWSEMRILERLFSLGARWTSATSDEVAAVRQSLRKLDDSTFVDVMKLLATNDYCSRDILAELGRTPAIRRRMQEVGFMEGEADRRRYNFSRPTRSREVVTKFGIETKKPARHIPSVVQIGTRHAGAVERRMTRQQLYDHVWSTPLTTLAEQWGLSGRGLAKACARIRVPVPPRGHWAKAAAGKRRPRPRLDPLGEAQAREIVVFCSS